ncbi:MAG: MarR family transcriptional regulator [Defluviitaleaceae bacterium]|nr:MarR family transcriptional regulator [Defluviitaleaceae bacterium]
MEAKEKVLETLKNAHTPMKAGELATATGLDKKEVDKAIKALKKDELITSPKHCFYSAV